MSGFIRQIKLNDGTPITPPSTVASAVSSYEVFANDAAYEGVYGPGVNGSVYYSSTESLVREHDGTDWVYSQQAFNSREDATTTGTEQDINTAPFNIVRFTEGNLVSIRSFVPDKVKVLYIHNDQGNTITLLNEDPGAPAGQGIRTGTLDNIVIEDKQTIPLVYDSSASLWIVSGGAGTGAGGLELQVITDTDSPVAAEIGKHYLTDSTAGQIVINLPQIATIPGSKLSGAQVKASDCKGQWAAQNVRVNAFAGDTIDFPNATNDTAIDLNVQGQNVQFNVSDPTTWCMDNNAQPLAENGGTGTAGAAAGINYLENFDAEVSVTTAVVVSGSGTMQAETATPLVGTQSFKATVDSTITTAPKFRHTLLATGIDNAFLDATKLKATGIFVASSTGWKVRVIDLADDSVIVGTEVDLTIGKSNYSGGFVPQTGVNYALEVFADTAPADATCTYDQLFLGFKETGATDLNSWKTYYYEPDEGKTDIPISGGNLPPGATDIYVALQPFHDSITNQWWMNVQVSMEATADIDHNMDVPGVENYVRGNGNGIQQALASISGAGAQAHRGWAFGNEGANINLRQQSEVNINVFWLTGTIRINGKPTWADYEPTGVALTNETLNANARARFYVSTTHSPPSDNPIEFDTESTLVKRIGNITTDAGIIRVSSNGTWKVNFQFQYASAIINSIYLSLTDVRTFDLATGGTSAPDTTPAGSFIIDITDYTSQTISIRSTTTLTDVVAADLQSWIDISKVSTFTSETTVVADLATANTAGFVKKNPYVFKVSDQQYTANFTNVLQIDNLPQGTYKMTLGARQFFTQPDDSSLISPQLNGSGVFLGAQGIIVGLSETGGATGENNVVLQGYTFVSIIDAPNATNTFWIDGTITSGSNMVNPYYILERLENAEEITTEWD